MTAASADPPSRVVTGIRLVDREGQHVDGGNGRSTLTATRLRSAPRYSQKAHHDLSRTISKVTPAPCGSSTSRPVQSRASSMTAAIRRSIWSVLVAQPAVVDLVEQRLCLGYERPRIDRRLRLDGGRQLWGAVVGVDDPVDVAAELQTQPEVALNW